MRLPKQPPSFPKLFAEQQKADPGFILRGGTLVARGVIERANNEGWNWEESAYRAHLAGLPAEQFWVLVKLSRYTDRQPVPLRDTTHRPFSYRLPAAAHRVLHLIDTHLGGTVGGSFPQIGTPDDQKRYLLTSLREEATASSLIEGAVVTREQAKEMIRSDRPPRTPGEQMVLNNYLTIQMLNGQQSRPLTSELLCEIQRRLTENTLDKPGAGGRFRTADENIVVWDEEDQQPLHTPPAADELPDRVSAFCAFANTDLTTAGKTEFIHPAVHAILLHFWLAYDHPFYDGNGRTARAVFYWAMLRHGYWLAEYLTISSVILGQPKQYARAYLDTEYDENDLSYFVLYHLGVVERSMTAFREYLERKTKEHQEQVVLLGGPFNPRQRALLYRAVRDPAARFTYTSHARSHGVTLPTARADLLHLERLKLLKGNRVGREFEFTPTADISAKLARLAGR